MQVHKTIAFSWLLTTSLFAQRIEPDRIVTAAGDLMIQPVLHKIVYPFHYRCQNGFSDVEEFKKRVNDANPAIEVRLRNWYPAYESKNR